MDKLSTPQTSRNLGYDLLKIFLAYQVIFSHSWELQGGVTAV